MAQRKPLTPDERLKKELAKQRKLQAWARKHDDQENEAKRKALREAGEAALAERRYDICDPKTEEPILGIANVGPDNGHFIYVGALNPRKEELDVGEKTYGIASTGMGDTSVMVRRVR